MATKADLAAQEAACSELNDWIQLAKDALAEPADPNYAREILLKAEMQCQFPADYAAVAELFVTGLNDPAYATEVYEQAENMCMEGAEYAVVGYGVAKYLGDKGRGKALLEQAAKEAKKVSEFLTLANYAEQGLGDAEFAKSLFAKVEEKCKTVGDYVGLSQTLLTEGNSEAAKTLYQKAKRFCVDIPSAVEYAQGAKNLFADGEQARKILASMASDCQFPKDYVELATGYQNILADTAKVKELLAEGANFAMAGDEFLDIAQSYWHLLGNKPAAAAAYKKALPEIQDRNQLLNLAKTIATDVDDKALAKEIYAKVEAKTASALDLGKLAQAIVDDLQDKDYAKEVYQRAEQKITGANDFIGMAGEVLKNLGDGEGAERLYRKAMAATHDFGGFAKLADVVNEKLRNNNALKRDVLQKTQEMAHATPEYLQAADKVLTHLADKDFAASLLKAAEERVTSLDEMKKVTVAIKTHFADDAEWAAQVTEKLQKREANQSKYAEFQKREGGCKNNRQFLGLVDQVMDELDDKFYAQKLLTATEKTMRNQDFNLNAQRDLITSIDRHLQDQKWVSQLLDKAAENVSGFNALRQVAACAATQLIDKDFGKNLAKKYYQALVAKIENGDHPQSYDYIKLAKVIWADLGDATWASALLDKAQAAGGDHFSLADMGNMAQAMGDDSKADAFFKQAVARCLSARDFVQLAKRLLGYGMKADEVRALYRNGMDVGNNLEKLRWVEGIVDVFGDLGWASLAYDALAHKMTGKEKAVYDLSRRVKLGHPFF